MSQVTQAKMLLDRTTKGALLYKNASDADGQAITTIYFRKSGLVEPYPGELTITVERHDDE